MAYTPSVFIQTRFLPATDTKGSRISARFIGGGRGRTVIPYDYAYSPSEMHEEAARVLICERLGLDYDHPRVKHARLLGSCEPKTGFLFAWDA